MFKRTLVLSCALFALAANAADTTFTPSEYEANLRVDRIEKTSKYIESKFHGGFHQADEINSAINETARIFVEKASNDILSIVEKTNTEVEYLRQKEKAVDGSECMESFLELGKRVPLAVQEVRTCVDDKIASRDVYVKSMQSDKEKFLKKVKDLEPELDRCRTDNASDDRAAEKCMIRVANKAEEIRVEAKKSIYNNLTKLRFAQQNLESLIRPCSTTNGDANFYDVTRPVIANIKSCFENKGALY